METLRAGVLATVDEAHVKTWSIDAGGVGGKGGAECTGAGSLGEGRTPAGGSSEMKMRSP